MSQCFDGQERWLRAVTESLRGIPARAARVELVLRRALVDGVPGYGMTWFVEGCGETAQRAEQAWGGAFDLALAAIMDVPLGSFGAPDDDTMAETGRVAQLDRAPAF